MSQDSYVQPAGGQTAVEHPQAQTVFILGIIGIFVPVVDIVAWILGHKALKEAQTSGGMYLTDGRLKTGKTLGMVFTILHAVGIVVSTICYVLLIAAVVSSGS